VEATHGVQEVHHGTGGLEHVIVLHVSSTCSKGADLDYRQGALKKLDSIRADDGKIVAVILKPIENNFTIQIRMDDKVTDTVKIVDFS